MYYIKTEIEFIDEFGDDWRNVIGWNINGHMEHLYGKEIETELALGMLSSDSSSTNGIIFDIDGWVLNSSMIKSEIELRKKKIDKIIKNENKNRICK